jgi:excisionase family DNA binding protein
MSDQKAELTSWKEIAVYLGVNIRTAQKWEHERGLPVNRSSGSRSRVSADTVRLNFWKRQTVSPSNLRDRAYRWPLGLGLVVEIHFLGDALPGSADIELLKEYLDLFKKTLS